MGVSPEMGRCELHHPGLSDLDSEPVAEIMDVKQRILAHFRAENPRSWEDYEYREYRSFNVRSLLKLYTLLLEDRSKPNDCRDPLTTHQKTLVRCSC